MNLTRLNVGLYAALIFGSGVLVGVFGQRLYTVNTVVAKNPPRPEEWRKHYMEEMQSRLKLRANQMATLNTILDETRTRFHEVRERSRPEMETIRQQQTEKIRAMLDDAQRPEYDKMREERERNIQKNTPHGPGPGL